MECGRVISWKNKITASYSNRFANRRPPYLFSVPVCFVKALANGGIFPRIFLGITVKMVLGGLREGYP